MKSGRRSLPSIFRWAWLIFFLFGRCRTRIVGRDDISGWHHNCFNSFSCLACFVNIGLLNLDLFFFKIQFFDFHNIIFLLLRVVEYVGYTSQTTDLRCSLPKDGSYLLSNKWHQVGIRCGGIVLTICVEIHFLKALFNMLITRLHRANKTQINIRKHIQCFRNRAVYVLSSFNLLFRLMGMKKASSFN